MKIYGDSQSGNCYKVQLICALLSVDYEWVPVDILSGDQSQQAFLAKNPLGKIPLLELEDGRCISESNAIVNYIAHGTTLLPGDGFEFAKTQQWQFFEQYSHEPYIAVARFIKLYLGLPDSKQAEFEAKKDGGYKALSVMEQQLSQTPFLTGAHPTTADISLFAYTHVADQGGFDLEAYPSILAWLDRVRKLPNFMPMKARV
ncbi:glutathione S-transferase family protein [Reinekea forsetii]|nr:glutathione S-transferase family protein [Reinekea forsetii]